MLHSEVGECKIDMQTMPLGKKRTCKPNVLSNTDAGSGDEAIK